MVHQYWTVVRPTTDIVGRHEIAFLDLISKVFSYAYKKLHILYPCRLIRILKKIIWIIPCANYCKAKQAILRIWEACYMLKTFFCLIIVHNFLYHKKSMLTLRCKERSVKLKEWAIAWKSEGLLSALLACIQKA